MSNFFPGIHNICVREVKFIASRLWVPVVMFGVTVSFTSFTAFSIRKGILDPSEFVRWDAEHYLSIAQEGYTFFPCSGSENDSTSQSWCGNAGWFPGYPSLIRLLVQLNLPGEIAGVLLSHFFMFLIFLLIWNGFFKQRLHLSCLNAILLVGFFPGSIYYQAVFPISMFTYFCLVTLYFMLKQKWLLAGTAGLCAAIIYPTGFLLSLLAIPAFVNQSQSLTSRGQNALKVAIAPLIGLFSVLAIHQILIGDFQAFFKVQAKYGHGIYDPLRTLSESLRSAILLHTEDPFWIAHLQTTIVFCLMIMVMWVCMTQKEQLRQLWTIAGITLVFWGFPLVMGAGVHLYRQESILLPMVVLFQRFPVVLQIPVLIVCILLKYQMTILFFHGILI